VGGRFGRIRIIIFVLRHTIFLSTGKYQLLALTGSPLGGDAAGRGA